MANEDRDTRKQSPRIALRNVARTAAAAKAAQRKADAAMAAAREQGFSFRDIADAAQCSHMRVNDRVKAYEAEQSDHA